MSFEEIPHTADVKIRVSALTLEALFLRNLQCPDAGDVWKRAWRENHQGDQD